MKTSNKVLPVLVMLPLTGATLADVEFGASVPREIVEQFIGSQFGSETTLYSDIFDAFPDFTLPDGFEVLASADQGMMQRVILRTELDEAAVNAAFAAAFAAEGWSVLPAFGRNAQQTGFVSATPPPQPLQLCSDQLGRLTVSVLGMGPRYVTLNHNDANAFGGRQPNCAETAEMMAQVPGTTMRQRGGPAGVQQYMPALVMPESDVASPGPMMDFIRGGSGGSSNDYETDAMLRITWSGDELLEHFADQVAEQGWEADSESIGTQVAFASWTKTVDGNALIGALTLMQTADSTWTIKFRVVRVDG